MKILSQPDIRVQNGTAPMKVNQTAQTDNLKSHYASEVVNQNSSGSLKFWKGTQTEYDAIVTKDGNTLYFIVEV